VGLQLVLQDYIQTFVDDFRELFCEYVFETSMVGIMQAFGRDEQCTLLDAVGELAKYGITSYY
jgi:hypothetical protein